MADMVQRRLPNKAALASALILAFSSVYPAPAHPEPSGPLGTPTEPVPSMRILRGVPLSPTSTAVTSAYASSVSTDGLCRDFAQSGGQLAQNAEICPTGGRPRAPEIVELARALRGGPGVADQQDHLNLVFEYVRNRIDTEFMFGAHKGALGTIIEASGTPFDQAQLMVEVLRASGMTAGYRFGTLTLNNSQFQAWTGLSQARAACEFLAAGGIPATVNGTAACNQTGAVTQVVMSHVWVQAQVGSSTYVLDPSYKPYEHITTLPTLAADMGLDPNEIGNAARQQQGGGNSQGYVTNQNDGAVATLLETYAENLEDRIRWDPASTGQRDLRGGAIQDLVGGREILPAVRPSGGWQSTQASNYVHSATWTGNIPDAFRARLTVTGRVGALAASMGVTFFVDEIYGRKLELQALQIACTTTCSGHQYAPQLTLDDVPLLAGTPIDDPGNLIYNLELTADHPWAANGGGYGDSTVAKSADFLMPATIVHGWGAATPALAALWEREQGVDEAGFLTYSHGGGAPPETPPQAPVSGDLLRARLGANWLAQFSHAGELHAELANSRLTHHHSLGVVSADINAIPALPGPPGGGLPTPPSGFSIADETAIIDIETSIGLTNRASGSSTHSEGVLARRAGLHAMAATAATLEGSVLEQLTDSPDVGSTARRFAWGNSPETGETPVTSSRRVMLFNSGNLSTAGSFLVTENLTSGVHGNFTPSGGQTQQSLNATHANAYRNRLLGAIEAYVGSGYDVLASTEALLGPGHRHGTEYVYNVVYPSSATGGQPIYQFQRHATQQAGGALIANHYDAAGDPDFIAHVLTRYSGLYKGAGGSALTQAQGYDPNAAADLLRDRFVDRSSIHGVNLSNGSAGYASPTLEAIGQGEFPYRLEARLELRGGSIRRPPSVPPWAEFEDADGLITNWHASVNMGSSGMDAMGASRLEAAAATVASFAAMQDVWRAAQGPERELTGMLVADWWGRRLIHNVATIFQGAASEQYVRLMDGDYAAPIGPARVEINYTRRAERGDLIVDGQFQQGSSQREAITRHWILDAPSPGPQITATSPQADVRRYTHVPIAAGLLTESVNHHWRLGTWEFPQGLTLTLTYGSGEGALAPTRVSTNLGYGLDLPDATLAPTGAYPCSPTVGMQYSIADAAGGISQLRVNCLVSRTPTIRPTGSSSVAAIFSADDTTTPSIAYAYDALGRVREARDRVSTLTPGVRGPHQFFVAEGYRGERIDPTGGRYAVETLRGGEESRHLELASDGVEALWRITSTRLDGRGRVVERTFPGGDRTQFLYDPRDNVREYRRIARPGGQCATGSVLSTPAPSSLAMGACPDVVLTAVWDETFNKPTLIREHGPNGDLRDTEFTYHSGGNGRGLLHTAIRPDPILGDSSTSRPTYTFTYNNRGQPVTSLDAAAIETRYFYTSGFVTRVETGWASEGVIQRMVNDARGRVIETWDNRPGAAHTYFTYDAMDRILVETRGTGSGRWETQTDYDAMGRPTQVRRRLHDGSTESWVVTNTGYTPTGQVWWTQDPDGDTAIIDYDGMDRPVTVTDPEGVSTRFIYDAAGQLLREFRGMIVPACASGVPGDTADADCGQLFSRFGYTVNGDQAWVRDGRREHSFPVGGVHTDPIRNTATMTYDGHWRLSRTTWPADSASAYNFDEAGYDVSGNATVHRTREGMIVRTGYDRLNRRISTEDYMPPGSTYGEGPAQSAQWWRIYPSFFEYDLAGRMRRASWGVEGAPIAGERQWTYDEAGRPLTHTHSYAGTFTFEFDEASNLTSVDHGDGVLATYRYDPLGRMDLARLYDGGVLAGTASLAYDTLDRRTGVGFGDGSSQGYSWQADGDLAAMSHLFPNRATDNGTWTYGHDRIGRQTSEAISNARYVFRSLVDTDTFGAATAINTYPTLDGAAITYIDSASQAAGLRSAGRIHHGDGTSWWRYYDTHGRLTHAANGAGGWQTYHPDALGERYFTQQTAGGTSGQTGSYTVSDGLRPETRREIDYVMPHGSSSWSLSGQRAYVLGPLPDERLIVMEGRGSGRVVSYPHADRRGSTVALARGGMAVETYAYDAFGRGRPDDALTGYPFRYTGQRLDPWTGSYHYKAREYGPRLGRFYQPDPALFVDGPNVYAYVGNSPLMRVDPRGMQDVSLNGRLISMTYGAAPDTTQGQNHRALMNASHALINDMSEAGVLPARSAEALAAINSLSVTDEMSGYYPDGRFNINASELSSIFERQGGSSPVAAMIVASMEVHDGTHGVQENEGRSVRSQYPGDPGLNDPAFNAFMVGTEREADARQIEFIQAVPDMPQEFKDSVSSDIQNRTDQQIIDRFRNRGS